MSLDERTLEWLNGKSGADYPAPCVRTGRRGLFTMLYCLTSQCDYNRTTSPEYCPLAADFRDVAEFEARVGESIARDAHNCALDEMMFQHQEGDKPQGWYILRDARLAVEAEMEKEEK